MKSEYPYERDDDLLDFLDELYECEREVDDDGGFDPGIG